MDRKSYIKGLVSGTLSFCIWGTLPIYWKMVQVLSPYQVFSQRVVWSFVFICILYLLKQGLPEFIRVIRDKQQWLEAFGPSVMISVNWFVYIWAVNNGFIVEASLGYYINPLIITLLGGVFLKEKLDLLQKIGLTFAALGVVIKTILYGSIPLISLTLAVSFGFYSLLKKKSRLDSLAGLGMETLIVGIPSLVYILVCEFRNTGITGNLPFSFWFLIAISGVATAVPLLLYADSTKLLPLNIVGFLQYLSPTISLLIGVFMYDEPFDLSSLAAFSLIWIGLIFFSYSQYRYLQKSNTADTKNRVATAEDKEACLQRGVAGPESGAAAPGCFGATPGSCIATPGSSAGAGITESKTASLT